MNAERLTKNGACDAGAGAVAIEGAFHRVVVFPWLEAAGAAVLAVGVRSTMAILTTVALLAAQGAAHRHPQAGLGGGARAAAVPARARRACLPDVLYPHVRRVPILGTERETERECV